MENWKMERQFDKAIEGLRKLKEEPVSLQQRALEPQNTKIRQTEDSLSDNDTFIISPFSENQTYTIKVIIVNPTPVRRSCIPPPLTKMAMT